MSFKICINEPKTRKSYQIEKEAPSLIGLKVGSKFDGGMVGLDGFTLQMTGGSDKCGFPMRPEIPGTARKKILLRKGIGFSGIKKTKKGKKKIKGMRKRKFVCGNQVSSDIVQINCKILEGDGDIALIVGLKKQEKSEDKKEKTEKSLSETTK